MTSRRSFFQKTLGAPGFYLTPFVQTALAEDVSDAMLSLNKLSPLDVATDEELWARMAQSYTVSSNILNLNNGGVSPQPKVVQDAVNRYYQLSNEAPSYYMWQVLDRGREAVRRKLADLAGCSPDEVAINRNTTEAMATVTWGLTLAKGDEIIMTKQDYPNMIQAWKQRKCVMVSRSSGWTSNCRLKVKTKLLTSSSTLQLENKNLAYHPHDQLDRSVVPGKRLCEEARKRNIISLVDGAHTFAHLDYKISDFDPDYFGTSLHKWLCAPFGTGMLRVKKENIGGLWPLFPNDKPQIADIRKFETLGTRSFAPEQAIGQAIDFQKCHRREAQRRTPSLSEKLLGRKGYRRTHGWNSIFRWSPSFHAPG